MNDPIADAKAAIAAWDDERAALNAQRNYTPEESDAACGKTRAARANAADASLAAIRGLVCVGWQHKAPHWDQWEDSHGAEVAEEMRLSGFAVRPIYATTQEQ